jgi:pimeloyl-ACP methyl ester carboxylesterase
MLANPVIVIPGITAAYLDDRYPLPPETIWSVLSKDYERAALHPDDLRYEAIEPALVRGGQLFEIAYSELIEEVRHNLKETENEPVPVFPFSYDWRQPLQTTVRELTAFVDEVIARTSLMRHYYAAGYGNNPKVNIVAHSMGGLVALAYLQQAGAQAKVAKVVSLATPFRGSFESVIKVTTGTANLGTTPPSSREREAARITPSLYCLLPDLPGAVTTEPGIPDDLFNPDAWQPSVLQTIEQYILNHGRTSANSAGQAKTLFDKFLSDAKLMRDGLKNFTLASAGLGQDDWLCVVGVDATTRIALKIGRVAGAVDFEFNEDDRQNNWGKKAAKLRRQTGDGTVPYDAAMPYFLPPEKLVCVSPSDFSAWELVDKAELQVGGFHGILPNMDMLHRLIVRYFKGEADPRGTTWGRPPVGVDPANWKPPLVGDLAPK